MIIDAFFASTDPLLMLDPALRHLGILAAMAASMPRSASLPV
jgi:hypothetical protein